MTDDVGPEGFDEVVPPSIEALIASRLDRLEPEERVVLERSAVIGKDFARSAVLHLSPPEALTTVDGRLAALEARGDYPSATLAPVAGRRVSLPPRPSPRGGICRDHKGAKG